MAPYTIVRSWSAICVGAFFTGVTGFVLLSDVLQHGAPVTTKHVMTLAVLAGTIYFGHRFIPEIRAWRLGTALGCASLFLAGTVACVLMSAGRNAEAVTVKIQAAGAINTGRAAAQKDRDEARARYEAALAAETTECSTGNGAKCQAKRITRMVRREEYDEAETRFRAEKPEQVANADIKAAADLLSRLPLVTANTASVEALLLLLFPFLQSLFCEIGAICGFAIGLGHGTKTLPGAKPEAKTVRIKRRTVRKMNYPNVRRGRPQGSEAKVAAERDLITYIAIHGHVPSQEFLRDRWKVRSKATVSEWLRDWEAEGLIQRNRDGRVKVTTTARTFGLSEQSNGSEKGAAA